MTAQQKLKEWCDYTDPNNKKKLCGSVLMAVLMSSCLVYYYYNAVPYTVNTVENRPLSAENLESTKKVLHRVMQQHHNLRKQLDNNKITPSPLLLVKSNTSQGKSLTWFNRHFTTEDFTPSHETSVITVQNINNLSADTNTSYNETDEVETSIEVTTTTETLKKSGSDRHNHHTTQRIETNVKRPHDKESDRQSYSKSHKDDTETTQTTEKSHVHDGKVTSLPNISDEEEEVTNTISPPVYTEEEDMSIEDSRYLLNRAEKIRILCWVLTKSEDHNTKAKAVLDTWGKRCDKLVFVTTELDDSLPAAVALPIKDIRGHRWTRIRQALTHIYEKHYNDADFFIKADDDTFVIIENLRLLLTQFPSSEPIILGCRYKDRKEEGYMSGGAGYVMSRAALRRFVKKAIPDKEKCKEKSMEEDVELGRCLHNVGVKLEDSRDAQQKWRFLPFHPEYHMGQIREKWFYDYSYYPYTQGIDCCSDTAITFDHIEPKVMYMMEYLLYHVRPFGHEYEPILDPLLHIP